MRFSEVKGTKDDGTVPDQDLVMAEGDGMMRKIETAVCAVRE
jgi:hypothetical protein